MIWFAIKTTAIIMVIFWLRATLPRFRIDQLMTICWQFLIPLTFANILVTGIYAFYGWPSWSMFLMSMALLVVSGVVIRIRQKARTAKFEEALRVRKEKLAT